MLSIGPKVCICAFKCCANLEEWKLFLKARLCSLYLFEKLLPVCPMYSLPQSGNINLNIIYFLMRNYFLFVLCTLYHSLGMLICI